MPHKQDKTLLKTLQIELVKYQNHLIKHNEKIVIIFEGRDVNSAYKLTLVGNQGKFRV